MRLIPVETTDRLLLPKMCAALDEISNGTLSLYQYQIKGNICYYIKNDKGQIVGRLWLWDHGGIGTPLVLMVKEKISIIKHMKEVFLWMMNDCIFIGYLERYCCLLMIWFANIIVYLERYCCL